MQVTGSRSKVAVGLFLVANQGLMTAGCATIGQRPVAMQRHVVGQAMVTEVAQDQAPTIDVELSSSTMDVSVTPQCVRREVMRVETVEGSESYNQTPALTAGMAVLGVLGAGAGVYVISNADSLAQKSTPSPDSTSKPPSGDSYKVTGGLLVAAGLTSAVIALVDVSRASGAKKRISTENKPGSIKGPAPCSASLAKTPLEVVLVGNGDALVIGATDQGKLSFALENIPKKWLSQGTESFDVAVRYPGTESLFSREKVKVAAVLELLEERAWTKLHPDLCETTVREEHCGDIVRFVEEFPAGKRVEAAEKSLRKYRQMVSEADQRAWDASAWETCRDSASSDKCFAVREYLRRFPKGLHEVEAHVVLEAADTHRIKMAGDEAEKKARQELQARQKRIEKNRKQRCPITPKIAAMVEEGRKYDVTIESAEPPIVVIRLSKFAEQMCSPKISPEDCSKMYMVMGTMYALDTLCRIPGATKAIAIDPAGDKIAESDLSLP